MKNIFLVILCIILIGITSESFGQESTSNVFEYNNVLKFSPFNMGQSELQVSYERYFLDRKYSIILFPSIYLRQTVDNNLTGFQIMGQYRFYLTHYNKLIRKNFLGLFNYGFYGGPYLLYFDYNEEYESGYWSNTLGEYISGTFTKASQSVEGGVLIGLQADITPRITTDFYIGGGVRKTESSDTFQEVNEDPYYQDYSVFDPAFSGVKPKIGFQIGITF